MKPLTHADIMAFEPTDGDDQQMIVEYLLHILENSGFEVQETNIPGTRCFEIEVLFEGSESLVYPIFFWVDGHSMLFMDIRVAGDPKYPLQRRYFKTMEYLKTVFQTGIEVNKNHGVCHWSWKGLPLHPSTMVDTLTRVLQIIQFQLGCYYEVFCLMDENASDDEVLERAKVIDELMDSNYDSEYYV